MAYDDDITSTIRLKAVDETGEVMRGMSKRIEETTSAFAKLTGGLAGGEFARRALTGFGDLQRTLERLQFATKASDQQMTDLGKTFDEVSKNTGRSTDDIAKAFQEFYVLTGQQFTPALEKMFKTISEASAVTGTSLESISRIAAAAVNNMKVPQEQMDLLIKKLAVDLPGSLESFAQMAPRVTEELNAVGLTGQKNAEEIALAYATLNRALGNTRLTASALNEIFTQLYNGSSMFGRMMEPTMMSIRKHGGDVTDVLEVMYQKLDKLHAFDPNTPPSFIQRALGLDFNTVKAIKILHDGLDATKRKLDESGEAADKFGNRLQKVAHDPKAAVNELMASVENLTLKIGDLMVSAGASETLKKFGEQAESIKRVLDDLGKGEYKKAFWEAVRPPGGHGGLGPPTDELDFEDRWKGEESENKKGSSRGPWERRLSRYLLGNTIAKGLGSGGIPEKPPSFEERFGDWPPKMQHGGIVTKPTIAEIGEKGPEAVVPLDGSGSRTTEENTEATKDNTAAVNRMTSYMRPTEQHGIYMNAAYTPGAGEMPTPAEAGLYGGGGRFGGGVRGRHGDGFSGGGGRFGGGGASGGWGDGGGAGSRGNRNNNRGNLKYGPLAQSFGATGADDHGFAIFPNEMSGDAAQQALVNSNAYKGLTLDEFGNKYSEGNEDWKKTVGKSLGIGRGDIVNNQDPRLLDAIRKAEGTGGRVGGVAGAPSNELLAVAEKVAVAGGPEAVSQFMAANGHPRDGSWCGEFAAAAVHAAGGVPPEHPEVASNWRHYGTEVDAPQPGDIAVRRGNHGRPVSTGSTGSHVNIVESAGQGSFSAIGGNQGRMRSSYPTNQYQFYRGTKPAKEDQHKSDDGPASFNERWNLLKEHQSMREEMERPIRMSVEAPQPPPLYSFRQRMARQQSRYQSDDMLGAARYASQIDIGFA